MLRVRLGPNIFVGRKMIRCFWVLAIALVFCQTAFSVDANSHEEPLTPKDRTIEVFVLAVASGISCGASYKLWVDHLQQYSDLRHHHPYKPIIMAIFGAFFGLGSLMTWLSQFRYDGSSESEALR